MSDKQVTLTLKTIADISDVTQRAKDIQAALNKIQLPQKLKTSFETTFDNLYKEVEKASAELKNGFKTKGDVTKYERTIESINTLLTRLYTNIQNIDATKVSVEIDSKQLQEANKRINDLNQQLRALATDKIKELDELFTKEGNPRNSKAASWGQFVEEMRKAEPDLDVMEKALVNLNRELNKHRDENNKVEESYIKYEQRVKAMEGVYDILTGKSEEVVDVQNKLNAAINAKDGLTMRAAEEGRQHLENASGAMRELTQNTSQYGKETVAAANDTQRLGSELDQFKNRIAYFFGINNAVRLLQRAFRSAYSTVKDLDKALTETAVVTSYTVQDMWGKIPEYTERANKLGVTILDVAQASTLYYQQGLKVNEVNAVTTSTLKMARIAGLDAAEATDRMTNALRGFNMEISETNAENVADVYSKLAAMSASNVDEISTAMTKVASLAHNANMDFETTSAFLAQIIETTRESAETAGTALKTVVARFSEVKSLYTKGELLGTDEEGEAIDVNKVSKALRTAGIDLNEYLTGMKGLDDIFIELASKWDSLDQVQQRYIATMAAGSRQQSRFIAMMQDYGRTQELVSAAQNASGASQEQYQKTLESLESKLNKLKNSWNEFITAIANQTVIKLVVDSLRTLLDIINKLTGNSGIAKLAVAFAGFKIVRNFVKNMFAGTKIGEMFLKKGQEAGVGFLGGLEKTIKGAKDFSFGKIFVESNNYREQQNALVTLNARQAEYLTLIEASSIAEAQEAASKAALTEALRAQGYSYEETLAIRRLDLSEQELGVILTNQEVAGKIKDIIATEGLTDAQIKEKISEELGNKVGQQGLLLRLKTNALTLASILGIKAETTAEELNIIAKEKGITVTQALDAVQKKALITMGAYVAAAAALVIILVAIANNTPAKQLEKATKAAEEASEAANEAANKYKNLKTAFEELKNKEEIVNNYVVGTTQWKDAVKELNEQVLQLVDTYPKLAKYLTYKNGKFKISEEGKNTVEEEVYEDYINKTDTAHAKSYTAYQKRLQSGYTSKELSERGIESGSQQTFIQYAFKNWVATGNTDLTKYNDEIFKGDFSEGTLAILQRQFEILIQDAEALDSSFTTLNTTVIESSDYGENSDAIFAFLQNTDFINRQAGYDERQSRAKEINEALNGENGDLIRKILLSGMDQLTAKDLTNLTSDKVTQISNETGINEDIIQKFIDSANEIFKGFEEHRTNAGIGDWLTPGTAANTTQKAFANFKDLSEPQQKLLNNYIQDIYDNITDEAEKQDFLNMLFGADWTKIDSLEALKTQFASLESAADSVDINPLIDKIIAINNATSAKATAGNLASQMTSQQEVINNVNDNASLDDKQKQLAVNAGVPENAFVYTAAGWVYTGDPQKIVDTFNQANSNMFANAVTTYQNEPNDTNRENVNQMAQMMGASGQNIDVSQFQGYDVNYDQSYVSQEGLQALEDYSKGLIASAEGVEELFLKQQDLQKAMKGTDKEVQSSARAMVKLGHEEIEAQKKFDKLTDSINDNIDVLKDGDKESVEYKQALSKVGSAMADIFGDDVIDEAFLNDEEHMKDIIAFAEGDEEAFKRLSDEIRSNGLTELTNQLNEVDGLMVDTEGLAAALNEATISIDGEADMSDIFNQLVAVYGSAEDAAAAIESLGGYQVSFDQYEDENGNITYKAKVADTFRRAQRRNFGGGGKKSGGGGSKEKEKYWDNPYDELYNLLEDQNEALRIREKLEREYDRILKRRTSTAQELKQNSLDEIANLQRELDIQRQIQAGRRRMINELSQQTHRDEEGNERTFADWGVTKYGWYDEQNGVMRIDWNAIDQVNDPELGGAIEAYISKLEELSQSFEETQTTIESMEDMTREIKERNMQEYLEFEERVYQAIIDREQKVIDEYSALSDTISESNSNILSSLRESIDLERQIRDNTKTEEDIADKEARLAYLQRDTSGANQTEILKLQQELDNARQSYGDTLVDQAIDQLERDNEIAEQQRQEQIEIMQAQLDYAERTGQFWPETYDLIATSFNANGTMNENSALANLLMNSDAFAGMSKFGQMNWIKELVEEWLKAQEGLTNWRNENAQDIYTSAENAMSAYDINSGAQKSIWFDGKNWVDDKGNVYNNVQWDEQGQRYTYGSAQAAPATPAQTEAPVSTPTQTSTQAQQYDTYTVKSGDNLSKIASKYGTTWQKIYDANKDIISNPNLIYPGWVLKIPKYAKGGLVDATGLAWLDGTKTSPEMVLSARDTENFIALRNALSQMLAQGGGKGGDNYFNIEINVDELANDYDVDQLADRIKKQIYDDSSYRNVNAISYLR